MQNPILAARPLTDLEKAMVRVIANRVEFQYRGELSTSRLTTYVYGSRDPKRDNWIKEALQEEDCYAEADRV
jgi:hypothetical protein